MRPFQIRQFLCLNQLEQTQYQFIPKRDIMCGPDWRDAAAVTWGSEEWPTAILEWHQTKDGENVWNARFLSMQETTEHDFTGPPRKLPVFAALVRLHWETIDIRPREPVQSGQLSLLEGC